MYTFGVGCTMSVDESASYKGYFKDGTWVSVKIPTENQANNHNDLQVVTDWSTIGLMAMNKAVETRASHAEWCCHNGQLNEWLPHDLFQSARRLCFFCTAYHDHSEVEKKWRYSEVSAMFEAGVTQAEGKEWYNRMYLNDWLPANTNPRTRQLSWVCTICKKPCLENRCFKCHGWVHCALNQTCGKWLFVGILRKLKTLICATCAQQQQQSR